MTIFFTCSYVVSIGPIDEALSRLPWWHPLFHDMENPKQDAQKIVSTMIWPSAASSDEQAIYKKNRRWFRPPFVLLPVARPER